MDNTSAAGSGSKLGLANVSRRLELCYGSDHALNIASSPTGTSVAFAIPLSPAQNLTNAVRLPFADDQLQTIAHRQ
jgi:LytS/YehU family sensor histidine kinase